MFPLPDIVVNTPEVVLPTTNWNSPLFLGPLLVSLIALLGVVYTNWRTGSNLLRAENRRHENALAQRTLEWQRESKATLYAEVVSEFESLRIISLNVVICAKPSASDPSKASHPEELRAHLDRFNDIQVSIIPKLARIRIFGEPEVARAVRNCGDSGDSLLRKIVASAKDEPASYSTEGAQRKLNDSYGASSERMVTLMRRALVGDESQVEPESKPWWRWQTRTKNGVENAPLLSRSDKEIPSQEDLSPEKTAE